MTFEEITIARFQKLNKSYQLRGDNVYELGMDILDIFEGMDRKTLKAMSTKDFDRLLKKYRFLVDGKIEKDEWVKEFDFEGVTYHVNQTPETWNVGQYISMGELTKNKDGIIDSMHTILAVMCEKDDSKVFDTSTRFLNLSVAVAYPIALFFCAVMSLLPPDTLDCLRAVLSPHSHQSGDGTT